MTFLTQEIWKDLLDYPDLPTLSCKCFLWTKAKFSPESNFSIWLHSRLHSGLNPARHFLVVNQFCCCLKMKLVLNILGNKKIEFKPECQAWSLTFIRNIHTVNIRPTELMRVTISGYFANSGVLIPMFYVCLVWLERFLSLHAICKFSFLFNSYIK